APMLWRPPPSAPSGSIQEHGAGQPRSARGREHGIPGHRMTDPSGYIAPESPKPKLLCPMIGLTLRDRLALTSSGLFTAMPPIKRPIVASWDTPHTAVVACQNGFGPKYFMEMNGPASGMYMNLPSGVPPCASPRSSKPKKTVVRYAPANPVAPP